MEIVKKNSVSRDLSDWELKKNSNFLEEEIGVDCEPVYEANEFEKELVRVSRKLIKMGEFVSEEESNRRVEEIWRRLQEGRKRKKIMR